MMSSVFFITTRTFRDDFDLYFEKLKVLSNVYKKLLLIINIPVKFNGFFTYCSIRVQLFFMCAIFSIINDVLLCREKIGF